MAELKRCDGNRKPQDARKGAAMTRKGKAVPAVLVWALLASALVAGCMQETGGSGGGPVVVTGAAAPVSSPLLAAVATMPIGTSTTVSDPLFGTVGIKLDREYPSAAGVLCRRFLMTGGSQAGGGGSRVACRETTGWRLLSLQGPSLAGAP